MRELRDHLTAMLRELEQANRMPLATGNPQEIRFRTVLREQEGYTRYAIQLLNGPFDKSKLKYALTVLYRDDEVADPQFRSWARVSRWMRIADPPTLAYWERLMEQIKRELKALSPLIAALYGLEEARFIVPPVYRPIPGWR
ncbi:hypothetical protein N6H14_04260 [Paenibacillus sp. CC-CFT747]|nr:hypothetical protein N6H14_04260 [Paenibacillus sp. CC-CFT747]